MTVPVRTWLGELAELVRTAPITPAVAATAATLPSTFPGDPADRLIYATAVEDGWRLVTKDSRMRSHRQPRNLTIWQMVGSAPAPGARPREPRQDPFI